MYNRKSNAPQIFGAVVGTIAGIAAISAGVVMIYNYFKTKKIVLTCKNCLGNEECPCHGKYYQECCDSDFCFAEEGIQLTIEDFEKAED